MSIDLDAIQERARDAAELTLLAIPTRLAREDVPALVAEVRRLSGVVADVLYLADQNEKTGDPIWPHEIRYVMTTDDLSSNHGCNGCEICS